MTTNSTGRKNRIIGTVSLGGSAGGLLLGLRHAHVAVFLRHHAQRLAERRAVALGLLQRHADRLHAFEIGALGEVLVGDLAVLQIGQFRGGEGELLGQRNRLRADLLADLAECRLDRHAGLDADQQQVERVRESAADRQLALLDLVLQEDERQLHADEGGEQRTCRA